MDTDRREKYAVAMAAVNGAGPEWAFEWYPEAEAAMQFADEEIAELKEERLMWLNRAYDSAEAADPDWFDEVETYAAMNPKGDQ